MEKRVAVALRPRSATQGLATRREVAAIRDGFAASRRVAVTDDDPVRACIAPWRRVNAASNLHAGAATFDPAAAREPGCSPVGS